MTIDTDTERYLLCEFAFDGCEQNHVLQDWVVTFDWWPAEAEGRRVSTRLTVEAGCGYAAEEYAMDYVRNADGEFDRMTDLRERTNNG